MNSKYTDEELMDKLELLFARGLPKVSPTAIQLWDYITCVQDIIKMRHEIEL